MMYFPKNMAPIAVSKTSITEIVDKTCCVDLKTNTVFYGKSCSYENYKRLVQHEKSLILNSNNSNNVSQFSEKTF